MIVNAGHGNTRLISKTDTNYNDGQLHSLTLLKNGKRLELRVDDIIQAIGFMEEEGSGTVHAVGEKGGLFFGGLSSDYTLNASVVAQIPLIGTIQDAIFNDKYVDSYTDKKNWRWALFLSHFFNIFFTFCACSVNI